MRRVTAGYPVMEGDLNAVGALSASCGTTLRQLDSDYRRLQVMLSCRKVNDPRPIRVNRSTVSNGDISIPARSLAPLEQNSGP